MNQEVVHVYFMPGMAANPSIFENIKLPSNAFVMHWLEWIIPNINETIEDYAKRILIKITHDNSVLIGVSFGGVLVQEMSKYHNFKKVIVVSSVKTRYELPKRMKIARVTGAYKIIPTQLLSNVEALAKYAFGKTVTKRIELYKKYLSINDKRYLDWAIKELVCWNQELPISGIIHIHGDKDAVFPIKNISNCILVKGGTHIMIVNKYKWFNKNLTKIIFS